jgi:hypothetical protein
MYRALRRLATLTLAFSGVALGTASAQSTRYAPAIRHVAPAPTPLPASAFTHGAFGEIARLEPSGFVLRLRSGRALVVDASDAIASGRYSAPIFVGKLVLVTGAIDGAGHFRAETVTRMARIDSSTRADH